MTLSKAVANTWKICNRKSAGGKSLGYEGGGQNFKPVQVCLGF